MPGQVSWNCKYLGTPEQGASVKFILSARAPDRHRALDVVLQGAQFSLCVLSPSNVYSELVGFPTQSLSIADKSFQLV